MELKNAKQMKRRKPADLKGKTKKTWEARGYHVANVEVMLGDRRSGFRPRAYDMYGFGDLFAFKSEDGKHWILQVGPIESRAKKRKQILENRIALDWLAQGHGIMLCVWKIVRPKIRAMSRSFQLIEEQLQWPQVGKGAMPGIKPAKAWQLLDSEKKW